MVVVSEDGLPSIVDTVAPIKLVVFTVLLGGLGQLQSRLLVKVVHALQQRIVLLVGSLDSDLRSGLNHLVLADV